MRKTVLWVGLFALMMAYFESSVVVYLRTIAYPEGFSFPLSPIPGSILFTEVGREAASLVMIVSVAVLAGTGRRSRFAFFLVIFGVWDIFYYVFLWVLLGWPSSILDWDVLFLIPVMWSGPVLAPVLVSLVMMAVGGTLLLRRPEAPHRGETPRTDGTLIMKRADWALLITGALVIFISFIWDYLRFLVSYSQGSGDFILQEAGMMYTPESFPWLLFGIGLTLAASPVVLIVRRAGKSD